jgi:hypothetical protein
LAARYWVGGDNIWNSTAGSKWSLTSGGAGGQATPTSADDVFLDNGTGTGNVTMGASYTASCKTLICTGYVGTLDLSAASSFISAFGNVTLGAGMTITGGVTRLNINATSTITSNGVEWTGNITGAFNGTVTVADNWTIGQGYNATGSVTVTWNGNRLKIKGGLTTAGVGQAVAGTTIFEFIGTGTIAMVVSESATMGVPFRFDTAGTITITGLKTATGASISYIAGTVNVTGVLRIGANITLNTVGMTWGTVQLVSGLSISIQLNSDLYVSGSWSFSAGGLNTTLNGFTVYWGGGTMSGTMTTNDIIGTTNWVINATCTINLATMTTGRWQQNITINTAGTVTFLNVVPISTKTLTYTSGTVVTTGSELRIGSASHSTTLNTAGITWNNVSVTNTGTVTVNSLLTIAGTLSLTGNTTFAGTAGWTCGTLTVVSVSPTHILVSGRTYTVTTAISEFLGTNAAKALLRSSSGGNQAIFTLNQGATQLLSFVNGTDIDSSLGQTIWSYRGVLNNTINWNTFTTPPTGSASTYVS